MVFRESVYKKIRHYCSYQERSHSETRQKLYELGADREEAEACIVQLIEDNFLNESRFADAFARGKFNLKKWGKIKIKEHLKQHQVSDYCIAHALKQIDTAAYYDCLEKLALKKWEELRGEKNTFTKQRKIYRYLIQKGYESDLIREVLKTLGETP